LTWNSRIAPSEAFADVWYWVTIHEPALKGWLDVKKFLAMLVCFGLVSGLSIVLIGVTGCNKDKKDAKPASKEIEISAKPGSITIEQGKSTESTITLVRGADAKKDVKLTVAVAPDKGVTAKIDPETLADKKLESKVTIESKSDTEPGDFTVTVTAKSDGSKDATAKTTVTVKKAAAVVPPKDTSLKAHDGKEVAVKQGDKGEGWVKLEVGKDVMKDITLKTEVKSPKEAKGKVTAKAADAGKKGENKVDITASEDATEGEYWVTVTAAADDATPPSVDAKIKVTVSKKK
jgi:uncharacterized membrane protein